VVAFKRAPTPPGPITELFDRLNALHLRAGEPGVRQIAAGIGRGVISHATVHAVFRGPRLPKWGQLELIVEQLRGDVEEFRELWVAARSIERSALLTPQADPSPPAGPVLEPVADRPGDHIVDPALTDALAEIARLEQAVEHGKSDLDQLRVEFERIMEKAAEYRAAWEQAERELAQLRKPQAADAVPSAAPAAVTSEPVTAAEPTSVVLSKKQLRGALQLLGTDDPKQAGPVMDGMQPATAASTLSVLDPQQGAFLVEAMSSDAAGRVLKEVPFLLAVDAVAQLPTLSAARILDDLSAHDAKFAAKLLCHTDVDKAAAVLNAMQPSRVGFTLDAMPTANAAKIVNEMNPAGAARAVRSLRPNPAAHLLAAMHPERAAAALESLGVGPAASFIDMVRGLTLRSGAAVMGAFSADFRSKVAEVLNRVAR
jgi:flagellar motility protein MotE (MotC chaperone)